MQSWNQAGRLVPHLIFKLLHLTTHLEHFGFPSLKSWIVVFGGPGFHQGTWKRSSVKVEAETVPGHFGFLMPLNQQAERRLLY